jgi:hypothetical protein
VIQRTKRLPRQIDLYVDFDQCINGVDLDVVSHIDEDIDVAELGHRRNHTLENQIQGSHLARQEDDADDTAADQAQGLHSVTKSLKTS